ncbi:MAG: ORF6N domain-containing protein [Ruminococcus sp.]
MHNLKRLEVHGIKVLTTRQLAEAYETERKVINNNYLRNKDKFILGKHYIAVEGDEMRHLRTSPQFEGELKKVSKAYFWTEKGALLHAKSLNTDKAWQVYDYLVDFYFRAKEQEPEIPPKKEVVPTQTKTEPVKNKVVIPHMEEPIFVFKNLLALADEQGITLKLQDLRKFDSILCGKNVAIRKQQLFEKVVYEAAYELAHYFIHYDQGDMIKAHYKKIMMHRQRRAAFMMIRMLDIKVKQKY